MRPRSIRRVSQRDSESLFALVWFVLDVPDHTLRLPIPPHPQNSCSMNARSSKKQLHASARHHR